MYVVLHCVNNYCSARNTAIIYEKKGRERERERELKLFTFLNIQLFEMLPTLNEMMEHKAARYEKSSA